MQQFMKKKWCVWHEKKNPTLLPKQSRSSLIHSAPTVWNQFTLFSSLSLHFSFPLHLFFWSVSPAERASGADGPQTQVHEASFKLLLSTDVPFSHNVLEVQSVLGRSRQSERNAQTLRRPERTKAEASGKQETSCFITNTQRGNGAIAAAVLSPQTWLGFQSKIRSLFIIEHPGWRDVVALNQNKGFHAFTNTQRLFLSCFPSCGGGERQTDPTQRCGDYLLFMTLTRCSLYNPVAGLRKILKENWSHF